ncbi:MAG: NAD(P)-dependent oxidoreductase [Candidatus Woesearchaeota archaeon]
MNLKIVFFDLEEWEIDYLKKRIIGHDVRYYREGIKQVPIGDFKDADIIGVFVFSPVLKDVLDFLPNLKYIMTMSTGFDHIDLEECARRNIQVCNVPSYGENTVAEHAFGLILNLSRNIHKAYTRTLRDEFSFEGLIGFDLKGKTLGVLGTGKIGRNLIRMAKGFDMNVVAYDPFPNYDLCSSLGFSYVSFDDLLKSSDVISIHVPLNRHTFHLINDETISKMKRGVLIINTARGAIIDTHALIKGLESGQVGGAGLDVLEGELLIKDEKEMVHSLSALPREQMRLLLENHALMKMSNVIVTPHLAFYSKEGLIRILNTTLDNLFDYLEHRGLNNLVK